MNETLTLTQTPLEFILKLSSEESKELLRILPNGEVIAPDLESASEAGRLFIESLRINGKTFLQRIKELESEISQLKNNKDEVY